MLIQTERGLVPFMPWVQTPRVAPIVLAQERELVLQLNASARASNELREATNQLRPLFASYNCEPPHRPVEALRPWPEADGTYTPITV